MNKVFREEKKFLINISEYISKSNLLEQVMIPDEHNSYSGYTVRSLYFDTLYDTDYFEKLAGIETRRKIRLRIYDTKQNFAMLEMKQKQGASQLKRSLKITDKEARTIIDGNLSPLLDYNEPFAAELYAFMKTKCYKPCAIVQYNRKAFIAKENKIRITFDSNIVATESSFDLFSSNINMNPVLDPYDVVFEVKYNGFLLGYIKQLINSIDKSELSVSKYALARHSSYQTHI